MKVCCPDCSSPVPAANISLNTGWAKCETCQEVFPLAAVVPGFSVPGPSWADVVPRPFNARAVVERTPGELLVHVRAEGMRAATGCLLGFAVVWLSFIAFWTTGALGVFFGGQPQLANWLFAAFSIPFWFVGLGMLTAVAWSVWGMKSVRIDREGMITHQRCLTWRRSRWIALDRVQHARPYDPKVKGSGTSPHGVEIVYRAGSFVLAVDSEEEEPMAHRRD